MCVKTARNVSFLDRTITQLWLMTIISGSDNIDLSRKVTKIYEEV
jgi:hypothetical protein